VVSNQRESDQSSFKSILYTMHLDTQLSYLTVILSLIRFIFRLDSEFKLKH